MIAAVVEFVFVLVTVGEVLRRRAILLATRRTPYTPRHAARSET